MRQDLRALRGAVEAGGVEVERLPLGGYVLRGRTQFVRDGLHALGFEWDPGGMCWVMGARRARMDPVAVGEAEVLCCITASRRGK